MVARGDGGQEGGEVESRALANGRQDGWRCVRGQGERVVRQAHWRAQVALVRGDAGVDGWSDERGGSRRGDDEGLRPRSALRFGLSVLILVWIISPVLAKALCHGISERSAASHDDRRLAIGLGWRLLSLAELSLRPRVLGVRLTRTHRHRHRDNQGHHARLSVGRTVFLLESLSRQGLHF